MTKRIKMSCRNYFLDKLNEHLLGVFAWSHIVLVGKGSGKIVNGIETKQK